MTTGLAWLVPAALVAAEAAHETLSQRSEKMRWSVCTCIRRAACPDGRWALIPS
jgi:hypothetical protein